MSQDHKEEWLKELKGKNPEVPDVVFNRVRAMQFSQSRSGIQIEKTRWGTYFGKYVRKLRAKIRKEKGEAEILEQYQRIFKNDAMGFAYYLGKYCIPPIPRHRFDWELPRLAVQYQNKNIHENPRFKDKEKFASLDAPQETINRWIVNFLRHETHIDPERYKRSNRGYMNIAPDSFFSYDTQCELIKEIGGTQAQVDKAYQIIRKKWLEHIASSYPQLRKTIEEEMKLLGGCGKQVEKKTPSKGANKKTSPKVESEKVIKWAIRKAAGKVYGEITNVDLEKVTGLVLYNKRLTNVNSLWDFTQLSFLEAFRENLSKQTWELTKMDFEGVTKLTFYNKRLTDVESLEKLTQLSSLSLQRNRLTDVKGLENLQQLEILNLIDNPELTKAQIVELQKALPNCEITHNAK